MNGSDCVSGEAIKLKWQEAIDHGKRTEFAGYNDWRLPSIDELKTIVDKRFNPVINPTPFPNTPSSGFWSVWPDTNSSRYAWDVNFSNGNSHYYHRDDGYGHVRLVRGGQRFGF